MPIASRVVPRGIAHYDHNFPVSQSIETHQVPKVAFLLPGSSDSRFYSQFAALNAAIKALSWTAWEPSIHVTMGPRLNNNRPDDLFERWRPHLREVQFTYVSESQYRASGNWAQVDATLLNSPRDANVYVTLDADTLPVSDLEEILTEVQRDNAVAGVMAHFEPPGISQVGGWDGLSRLLGLKPLELTQYYSLLPADTPRERRAAPVYFNGGVGFFSKTYFDTFVCSYFALRHRITMLIPDSSDFSGQLAAAFAVAECGMPARVLPMRYNYPNDDLALLSQPGELSHVVVFHYLRTNAFDRGNIFSSAKAYCNFLEKPLGGVNLAFRDHVVRIFGTTYPFP
jgi:hypothetical protein